MMFSKVAVFGSGVLGGSVLLAARERGLAGGLAVWGRSEESLREARESGVADLVSTDCREVAEGAGLVVLATPVGAMEGLAREMAPFLAPGAVVTDVGSVKGLVVRGLERALAGSAARFVGSHPMAGSERTGFGAGRAGLFEGAVCLVTPTDDSDPAGVSLVEEFWRALGCRTARMSPEEHDWTVALVSHVPHVAASALVNMVLQERAAALGFCGGGFRDTTRVAAGAAGMWAEILLSNREPVAAGLRALAGELGRFAEALAAGEKEGLVSLLEQAKVARDGLRG